MGGLHAPMAAWSASANSPALLKSLPNVCNANVVLPITDFQSDRSTLIASVFGCFDPKVVAMLAEIFMVRSEAKARLVEEVLPSSTSRFIPLSPRTQFTFKKTEPKVAEAPREEPPVGAVQ